MRYLAIAALVVGCAAFAQGAIAAGIFCANAAVLTLILHDADEHEDCDGEGLPWEE